MPQYQTFPDASGDSRTFEKLKALKLPDLSGRSFLDVGCNEGFFCGFAKFLGAKRVLGIDRSALFIERARRRFPDIEFLQQGWEQLPDERFDVILLASALHYADDQAALRHRLVEHLTPNGVLVLELGIVSAPDSAWVKVQRGIDEREFPTMAKLREVLRDHAWKLMGRSVAQDGDPVGRHVLHISRRRPIAYLLMEPPAFGKSSIASRLFGPAGIPVISGDQDLSLIASGKLAVPKALRAAVAKDYSPFALDQIIDRIFDAGLAADLIQLWAEQGGHQDFVLDMYVPSGHQPSVTAVLSDSGYLPVTLRWDRAGPSLIPAEDVERRAKDFYAALALAGAPALPVPPDHAQPWVAGYVDHLSVDGDRLQLRGWAVDQSGVVPSQLRVRANGRLTVVEDFEVQARPDVQKHLNLAHADVGFYARVVLPGVFELNDLAHGFSVTTSAGAELKLGHRVLKLLAAKK
jgi:SAM-dependent methyltransferase